MTVEHGTFVMTRNPWNSTYQTFYVCYNIVCYSKLFIYFLTGWALKAEEICIRWTNLLTQSILEWTITCGTIILLIFMHNMTECLIVHILYTMDIFLQLWWLASSLDFLLWYYFWVLYEFLIAMKGFLLQNTDLVINLSIHTYILRYP